MNSSDGDLGGISATFDTSTLNQSGGSATGLSAFDDSTMNISGGIVAYLGGFGRCTVNLSGGFIGEDISIHNNGSVNMSGGTIGDALYAYDSSTVKISGGDVRYNLYAYNDSIINVSGGSVRDSLYAYDNSTLNFFGTGLVAPLINPNVGGYYSLYSLSGTLLDGTVYTNKNLYIQNGTGARFTLNNAAVPAPSSALVLLFGAVPGILALRKRRRNQ